MQGAPGLGNTAVSASVSPMKTSAMVELNPGMLIGSSRAGRKGAIHYSIPALGASMSVVWALTRCRYSSALTRWWLVNRPGSASINPGFFERILPKCRVYPVAVPGVMMERTRRRAGQ
jgi:hypothetical protein